MDGLYKLLGHSLLLTKFFLKDIESIFGKSATSPDIVDIHSVQESQIYPMPTDKTDEELSHVDASGQAQMVDISAKEDTKRVAIAGCKVILGEKAFGLVAANQITKGDVLNVAKIAGICGAKQTSNLIPLCHNIILSNVRVDLRLNEEDFSVEIEGEAATTGKTGVEMEAMTAVSIAGLTVYDMCKAVSKDIQISNVCLQHKSGGKSGTWSRNLNLSSNS